MLGSIEDAEDALQEALLGAWRGTRRRDGSENLLLRYEVVSPDA